MRVKAKISHPVDRSRNVKTDLLADTGAIYTALPADLLHKVGVTPTGKRKFKLANGKVETYPTAEVFVEVDEQGVTSLVAFLPETATPLLGVTTLELLGLQVDPTTGKLKPLELLLL